MRNTTLCYIERGQQYLMLHRVKKENDLNHDKWVGIGGKFEGNETPDECLLREAYEETGLTLTQYRLRGLVTFNFVGSQVLPGWETEYMFLYTADAWEGELTECSEGDLAWIPQAELLQLSLWPGDRLFLDRLLREDPAFFTYKMIYDGDRLLEWHEESPAFSH